MNGKQRLIREAISSRSCLLARYRGTWLTLCPHLLGTRRGEVLLLAYCAAGKARAARNGWLYLRLADLSYVRPSAGPWLPGPQVPTPPLDIAGSGAAEGGHARQDVRSAVHYTQG